MSQQELIQFVKDTSYPTSIITRIETAMSCKLSEQNDTSYPTSIITRIETRNIGILWAIQVHFLPHFHYNKDWN